MFLDVENVTWQTTFKHAISEKLKSADPSGDSYKWNPKGDTTTHYVLYKTGELDLRLSWAVFIISEGTSIQASVQYATETRWNRYYYITR